MDTTKVNTIPLSEKAKQYLEKLDFDEIPMGKVKAMAKAVKKDNEMPILRGLFWYSQARLCWSGKTDFSNTDQLVQGLEADW